VCVHGVCGIRDWEDGHYDLNGNSNDGCEYACTPSDREAHGASGTKQTSSAMGETTIAMGWRTRTRGSSSC
jgi:hypothetical protein